MRKFYTLTVLLLVCHWSFGQKLYVEGKLIQERELKSLEKQFSQFEVFEIDPNSLAHFFRKNQSVSHLQLNLGTHNWSLQTNINPLKSEDYRLQTMNTNGITSLSSSIQNYQGHFPQGKANLTISFKSIIGTITEGGQTFYLEPLNRYLVEQPTSRWILYQEHNVLGHHHNFRCGLTDFVEHPETIVRQAPQQTANQGCIQANYALAADYSMYSKFDDIYDLEAYLLSILSLVQDNFNDNGFDSRLQLKVVTTSISTCPECDPWGTTRSSEGLLDTFGVWGNQGGFGDIEFDLASLWTDRSFTDSLVGIAWLNEMCNDLKYNVLQDFTSNLPMLRTLQTHEIAHNLGAIHVRPQDETIMAPQITVSQKWAIWTTLRLNSTMRMFTRQLGCLRDCDTINFPRSAFISSIQSGCAPFTADFQINVQEEILTPKWIFEGGTPEVSFDPNPSVLYEEPGDYAVRLLVQNTSGADTLIELSYIRVDGPVNPFIEIDYTPGDRNARFTTLEADSVIWNLGDGTITNQITPDHVYDSDGVYPIQLITFSECGADTLQQELKIISAPQVAFSFENVEECPPIAVDFTNSSVATEGIYSWEFQGGTPNTSTEENPTVLYENEGTFEVKLTVSNEAGSRELTQLITINASSTLDADFDFTINGDSTVVFVPTMTNAEGYQWDFGDGNQSTDINPQHSYRSPGEYDVTLITSNSCRTDTIRKQVTITTTLSAPMASINISDQILCSSQALTLDASESLAAETFFWSVPGAIPDESNEISPTFEFRAPGFYNVRLIVGNEVGRDTLTIVNAVLILNAPTIDFSFQIQADNSTVSFRQNTNSARMQLWDFGDGNTSTARNPSHQYQEPGIYDVLLIAENECGQDSILQMVNIGNQPSAPQAILNLSPTTYCVDEQVRLDGSNSFAVENYFWTIEGATPVFSTEENPDFQFDRSGSYDIQLIVSNEVGTDTLVLEDVIRVIDTPILDFDFMSVESDTMIQFNPLETNIDRINWDFGDGTTSEEINPIHTFPAPGNYMIQLVIENQCGVDTLSRIIQVGRIPMAPVAVMNIEPNISCVFDFVRLSASESLGANAFKWNISGEDNFESNGETVGYVFSTPGIYDVQLIVFNELGSDTIFSPRAIQIVETPTASFSFEANKNAFQFNNLSEDAIAFFWEFGDGNTSTEENPFHAYVFDGDYEVKLSAINPCDTVTYQETINIAPFFPRARFMASATGGCAPSTVSFINESENAENYQWSFPGGIPEISTEENPVVIYPEPGIYDVELTVFNSSGRSILERTDYIEVIPSPMASFTFEKMDSNLVQLRNTSINANTFDWTFGGYSSILENPIFQIDSSGVYEIQLIAGNFCNADTMMVQEEFIIMSTSLSYQEPAWAESLNISPNPNQGQFKIEVEGMEERFVQLELINVTGQSIYSQRLPLSNGRLNHLIAPGNIPAGLYVLKIGNLEQFATRRIIVTR